MMESARMEVTVAPREKKTERPVDLNQVNYCERKGLEKATDP